MTFCECEKDGWCPRYKREMGGRMRELCTGVNVDLGTAAAFREQWTRELPVQVEYQPLKRLILKTRQAPGDAVAMTSAIYSLHKAYPGKYVTAVESYWPEVFAHNPDVLQHLIPTSNTNQLPGFDSLEMHYPAIHQSNERAIHFMQAWCEHLSAALGVPIPLATNRPHLYFDMYDYDDPPVGDFWLICSGGKRDFTTKLWGHQNYQNVVDQLRGQVNFVQVGGAKPIVPWCESTMEAQEDLHPRLEGTADMVGKTTLRQLFNLVRRSRGVVCGVSLLMHVSAALEKPAIVIAGGREPVAWNAYPKQQYVHTVGALPCRDSHGRAGACWRYRTEPLYDGLIELNKNPCERPIDGSPECMTLINPTDIANLVLQYNEGYEK